MGQQEHYTAWPPCGIATCGADSPGIKSNRPQTAAGHRTIRVRSVTPLDFMKSTTLYIAAALAALSAVALGAFVAHGLKNQLSALAEIT